MSSLIKSTKLAHHLFKNNPILFVAVRNRKLNLTKIRVNHVLSYVICMNALLFSYKNLSILDWNKDYKPGPYPKTAAERAAAAEKYGLPVEEYQPYPDDGTGCGDYPALPYESGDSKDPYYPWDNPEIKRNFNEVVRKNSVTIFKNIAGILCKYCY